MLTLYRRHREQCPHANDRYYRKCACAVWCEGTVEGKYIRRSLKTRSWQRGDELKKQLEDGKHEEQQVSIEDALAAFVRDCEARNLSESTLRKYRLLQSRLRAFGASIQKTRCSDFDADTLRAFRGTWHLSPRTDGKMLERLRSFFKFCVDNGWLQKNPAKIIKAPIVKPNPTLPFSGREVETILGASDGRCRTFFKVLLHTGLRIIDAAALRPEKIVNGKLFLYTAKTGTPVWLPLPPDLIEDLGRLKLVSGMYFAVESTNAMSIAEYYRQKLHKIDKSFRPHRFRDTFAVNLLLKGVDVADVAALLGNTPSIIQKHYAPWIAARQSRLESIVMQTWEGRTKNSFDHDDRTPRHLQVRPSLL